MGRGRVCLALVLLVPALTGCPGDGRAEGDTVCDKGSRSELLSQQLTPRTLSKPFAAAAGEALWIRVTRAPAVYDGQPFGRAGGIQLYLTSGDAAPRIDQSGSGGGYASQDPTVVLPAPLRWVRLQPTGAPRRVYSLLLNPEVQVIACPG